MRAFAKIAAAGSAALLLSGARAAAAKAHGLNNNWLVRVEGKKDSKNCVQITSASAITDLGMNLQHNSSALSDDVVCVQKSKTCSDNYVCSEVSESMKPNTFNGCEFDASTGETATTEGVIMDGLCYTNFIVNQKNFNGAPGLAPDKVHVRTDADLHTRACLIVDYCATTGYYLVKKPQGSENYEMEARFDVASAEKVFNWLVAARHPECEVEMDADEAAGRGGLPLALGLGTLAAALAA